MAPKASFTVYIVDDDDAVRDSLAEMLEIEGFKPQEYSSCEEFLEQFHPAGNACLLLDVRMPGMDGIELLEILGRRLHNLPVIVMSGNQDAKTKARALRAGAADFLDKPLNVDRLIQSLEAARR